MNFDYLKRCLTLSAEYFRISEEEILKETREETIVGARHIAIFLARRSGLPISTIKRYLSDLGYDTATSNLYYIVDRVQRKFSRKDPLTVEAITSIRPNVRRKK
jgi:hypothetical protein